MGQRPPHARPPAYLSKSPPLPAPSATQPDVATASDPAAPKAGKPDPTRYGDWVIKGIAIDF